MGNLKGRIRSSPNRREGKNHVLFGADDLAQPLATRRLAGRRPQPPFFGASSEITSAKSLSRFIRAPSPLHSLLLGLGRLRVWLGLLNLLQTPSRRGTHSALHSLTQHGSAVFGALRQFNAALRLRLRLMCSSRRRLPGLHHARFTYRPRDLTASIMMSRICWLCPEPSGWTEARLAATMCASRVLCIASGSALLKPESLAN
jgi:hypothetical protein